MSEFDVTLSSESKVLREKLCVGNTRNYNLFITTDNTGVYSTL